ncbi:hypothetical protein IT415_01605 [bacterium]|nr:hypothetical protein [bacterium]
MSRLDGMMDEYHAERVYGPWPSDDFIGLPIFCASILGISAVLICTLIASCALVRL